MKISIVVLTYNSADFVTETLESVWRQSFNGDLELIVADDCSTDDTVRICQAWIDSHRNRFCSAEVLTSPINTGVTANVDRACRKASGEWIKVIAGDDILMDDCIDKLFAGAVGTHLAKPRLLAAGTHVYVQERPAGTNRIFPAAFQEYRRCAFSCKNHCIRL